MASRLELIVLSNFADVVSTGIKKCDIQNLVHGLFNITVYFLKVFIFCLF